MNQALPPCLMPPSMFPYTSFIRSSQQLCSSDLGARWAETGRRVWWFSWEAPGNFSASRKDMAPSRKPHLPFTAVLRNSSSSYPSLGISVFKSFLKKLQGLKSVRSTTQTGLWGTENGSDSLGTKKRKRINCTSPKLKFFELWKTLLSEWKFTDFPTRRNFVNHIVIKDLYPKNIKESEKTKLKANNSQI